MAFPILGSGSLASGYNIENSCKFEPNAYVSRYDGVGDESSNAGKIGTVSLWTKRGDLGRAQGLFVVYEHNGQGYQTIWFNSDDTLQLAYEISGTEYQVKTNAKFRDPSAWYHVVAMTDTTQGTDSNRMKIYVNGTEQSYGSTAYPPQNTTLLWGKGDSTNYQYRIGNQRGVGSTSYAYYNGYIAEVHLCMGQNYTASEFGETDDNGVWIPKEADVSYGTNGVYYEFKQTGTSADASGIGADTSGTGNHAGVGGLEAIDVTTDTPTNNFMTWNPLYTNSKGTFAEGNCQVTTGVRGSAPWGQVEFGSFCVNSGKWYFEVEVAEVGSGGSLGLGANERAYEGTYVNGHNNGGSPGNIRYNNSSGNVNNGSSTAVSGAATYTDDDTIGFAMDLDNNKMYIHKNGTYINSGDPAAGSNGITMTSSYRDYWTPWVSKDDTTHNAKVYLNTGNPVLANDSGNADDNGYGDFEYDVPAGFYALCTKNLATYG